MLDPKLFRADLAQVAQQLKRRNFDLDTERLSQLEQQRKSLQVATQELQNERNTKSKSIGKAKAAGEDIQPLLDEVARLKEELQTTKSKQDEVLSQLDSLLMGVPNIPHDSVPHGLTEDDNVEVRKWGEPQQFDFEVRHPQLATSPQPCSSCAA